MEGTALLCRTHMEGLPDNVTSEQRPEGSVGMYQEEDWGALFQAGDKVVPKLREGACLVCCRVTGRCVGQAEVCVVGPGGIQSRRWCDSAPAGCCKECGFVTHRGESTGRSFHKRVA